MENNIKEIFNEIKNYFKSNKDYKNWLKPISISRLDDKNIYLKVENLFTVEWFKTYYQEQFSNILKQKLGKKYNFLFEESQRIETNNKISLNVNPIPFVGFDFENFLINNTNKLAYSCALNFTYDNFIDNANLLFIYGDMGLGKTHLTKAIINKISKQNSNLTYKYFTAEQFIEDFISSVNQNNSYFYSSKFSCYDLLIIEDIQDLSNKTKTQEKLLSILKSIENKTKVVITSSYSPSILSTKNFNNRLISLLRGGQIVRIDKPDEELALNFINSFQLKFNLILNEEITSYILSNFYSDIRILKSCLNRIFSFCKFKGEEYTLNLQRAKSLLKDSITLETKQTIPKIQDAICKFYNISSKILTSQDRSSHIANARKICIYLSKKFLKKTTYKEIALSLNRDFSTIIYGYKTFKKQLKTDPTLRNNILEIEDYLKNNI